MGAEKGKRTWKNIYQQCLFKRRKQRQEEKPAKKENVKKRERTFSHTNIPIKRNIFSSTQFIKTFSQKNGFVISGRKGKH
jgi:hypothetical protein